MHVASFRQRCAIPNSISFASHRLTLASTYKLGPFTHSDRACPLQGRFAQQKKKCPSRADRISRYFGVDKSESLSYVLLYQQILYKTACRSHLVTVWMAACLATSQHQHKRPVVAHPSKGPIGQTVTQTGLFTISGLFVRAVQGLSEHP